MSDMFTFLSDLSANNDRDWFHAHKDEYAAAQAEFEALIRELIAKLRSFDDSVPICEPKALTFKLQRDTRFSHDKSPYNPAFRCHISSAGKAPVPVGYFLSIRSGGQSFLGGGLFADMFRDATQLIRAYIYENADEFLRIVNAPDFRMEFRIDGTALKSVPKEYPADCAVAEYLKNKSWYIEYPFDAALTNDRAVFVRYAAEKYRLMKPFNDYLNCALAGFSLPTR